MNPRKIALIVILTGLCIGTNYALLPFLNVKFMDLIVFVSGFCFGPVVGGLTGVLSWGIYGTLNPYGFSLPVWISTMAGEAIFFGVAGGLTRFIALRKNVHEIKDKLGMAVLFGIVSLFLTLGYDLTTNYVFAYVSGMNFIVALIVYAVPFGVAHLLSNTVFFSVGCVPAVNSILKITGGEKTVNNEK